MRKLRWQLLIIFLTGLVVGILLISEKPESNPISAPKPQEGGVYVEAVVGKFQRLNPVLDFYNPADQDIDRLIFNRLISFKDRGIPQPELAESWGYSQDGTVFNFTLRSDAFWHDGEPIVSEDVVFTINMLRDGLGIVPDDIRNFWSDIEVKNLSDNTLQFLLPEPFAPFLDYLSFGILPSHLLGDLSFDELINSDFNLNPIGSGPFKFEGLVIEDNQIQGVVLKSNDAYFGKKAFINQIVFKYVDSSEEGLQAYRDGQVQGISLVDQETLSQVLIEPNLSLFTARRPELMMVLFNLNDEQVSFFQDTEVRKALYSGLNRQRMIDNILGGQAILADGPIFPGTWAYYDGLKTVPFDTLKAITSLKQAGFVISGENNTVRSKDDKELRFELLYPDNDTHRRIAESMQKDWEVLGVAIEIRAVPYDELIRDNLEPRNFQAVLVDLNLAHTPDPDPYPFWDQVQATGGQNYSQWDNNVASDYLEQARVTIDLSERAALYRNFQVVFSEELPALPLFYPVYTYTVANQVQGIQIGPLFDTSDRLLNITDWYLAGPVQPTQTVEPVTTTSENNK